MQLIQTPKARPGHTDARHLPGNLVCFSHLRWDFVFQRPQHILSRLSQQMDVFYIEEPVEGDHQLPHYVETSRGENLTIIVPHIQRGLNKAESLKVQKQLFEKFMKGRTLNDYAFWYYTPMALSFTRDYSPAICVYDCMDELSAFKFAPEELKTLEKELLQKSDIVFTGGHSLYDAKKSQHTNIHAFPSSIDKQHFAQTRLLKANAPVNKTTDRLQLGFYGVIDERFDIDLIRGIADLRPEWDIILIGPVVKIDPTTLPKNDNIKYRGAKTYQELPKLMSDWDIALIPFLLNESTRYISPTKTPEYLAAGLPVISTPIRDVINPYGKHKLVMIGHDAADFVRFAEETLITSDKKEWLQRVDFFLSNMSWDLTCEKMLTLMGKLEIPGQPADNLTKLAK